MRTDPRSVRLARLLAQGTALVVAIVEAMAVQARPVATDGLRLNARNTPEPAGDAYQTGRSLLGLGDVNGALSAFRQAVLDAPQSVDALNGLAVCYDRLGRYDLSRSYYDAALAVDAGSALVLNNLGYSLYLQGRYDAAIPVLQRAMVGADPVVAATSQRVLTLVAARMRDANASASAAAALAEVRQPQARIELTANGEQRLVLAAPALDRRLVASLGEDAALVTIAAQVTAGSAARAESRRNPAESHDNVIFIASQPQRTATMIGTAGIGTAAAKVVMIGGDAAAAVADAGPNGGPRTILFAAAVAPAPVAPAAPAKAKAPATISLAALRPAARARRAAVPLVASFTPSFTASRALSSAHRAVQDPRDPQRHGDRAIIAAATPGRNAKPRAASAQQLGHGEDPAWLLASRRVEKGNLGSAAVSRGLQPHDAPALFDSDDAVLNAFAARMRGNSLLAANDDAAPARDPGGDGDPNVAKAVVIARLEALLARVRPA